MPRENIGKNTIDYTSIEDNICFPVGKRFMLALD